MSDSAAISEIFSSVQGEGPYIGFRQIFVRFLDCNLDCGYCDTENEPARFPACRIEVRPGSGNFEMAQNPLSKERLSAAIKDLEGRPWLHHGVSLTGGEPLLQAAFLARFLPSLKGRFNIYLETNGTLTTELKSIIELVDIIAMDMKLPCTAKAGPLWEEHHRFLELAATKEAFVKTVVSSETRDEDLLPAVELIATVDSRLTLVIQPVTDLKGGFTPPSPERLMALQALASAKLRNVRIIPQSHRMMGMM